MTMPTTGVAGEPIDAPTAVKTINTSPPVPISTPNTWARNIAATP